MGSECFVFVGTAGEVFTREADGQHSQDQLPSMDKFSNIGRNSLNLDIFSPLNDGKIPHVAPFAFLSLYCPFFSLAFLSSRFYGPFLGFSILSTGFKAHGFGDTPTSRNGECFIMLHYVQEIMNVAY